MNQGQLQRLTFLFVFTLSHKTFDLGHLINKAIGFLRISHYFACHCSQNCVYF